MSGCLSLCCFVFHASVSTSVCPGSTFICLYAPTSRGHLERMSVCVSGISVSVRTSIFPKVHPLLVRSFVTFIPVDQHHFGHLQCHVWLAWVPSVL